MSTDRKWHQAKCPKCGSESDEMVYWFHVYGAEWGTCWECNAKTDLRLHFDELERERKQIVKALGGKDGAPIDAILYQIAKMISWAPRARATSVRRGEQRDAAQAQVEELEASEIRQWEALTPILADAYGREALRGEEHEDAVLTAIGDLARAYQGNVPLEGL